MERIYQHLARRVTCCSNLSNFNYKPQIESHQQHVASYMECHLHSVAIMTEMTSRHMECTHFNLDYSQISAVARQWSPSEEASSSPCSWTAASLVKQHKSSSSRRAQTSKPPSIEVLAGILLTSAGKPHSLNVGGEGMLRPQQLPCSLCTSPLAARACGG